MSQEIVTTLLGTYLFANLTPADLLPLSDLVTRAKYKQGSAVYRPGDAATAIHVVTAGRFKEAITSADGDELTIELLPVGSVFGEVGIFAPEGDRIVSVVALEDGEVLTIAREYLVPFLLEHPDSMMRLLGGLVAMIRETTEFASTISFSNIKDRLAIKLAELADLHGRAHPRGQLIELALPQTLLASLVAANRTNVNRALADLEREGAISREGRRYVVTDPASLRHSVLASERLLHRRNNIVKP